MRSADIIKIGILGEDTAPDGKEKFRMEGNLNKAKKALILEGVLAFAALAFGVAFFGMSDMQQPVEKAVAPVAVSQPSAPVKPAPVQKPAPAPAPAPKPEPKPEPAPEPIPEPEPALAKKEYVARKAVYVGINQVLDGSALNMAKNSGAEAIIVNMKHDSGNLNWASQQEIAQRLGLSSNRRDINEKLKAFLANEEFHMVARISAFRDRLVGTEMEYTVINNKNNYWTDEKGLFWTSVGNADIRSYVTGCAVELAQLGFDEIMVENAASPDSGYLDPIPAEERFDTASEEAFLSGLKAAIEPTGAYLSINVKQDTLTAEKPVNSLTADMVRDSFDHCWQSVEGVVGMLESKNCDEFCKVEVLGAYFDGTHSVVIANPNTGAGR